MRSIRFRLTAVYSVALFLIAAGLLTLLYAALAASLDSQPVSRSYEMIVLVPTDRGDLIPARVEVPDLSSFEAQVNKRALDQLQTWSFVAAGVLFVLSLGIGWVVAGRALQPVQRITAVARDIQATDLSRRIGLPGPDDELKQMADTFDDMLGRLDRAFAGQRRFIHEASHELRNPLATIRTNLEVTMGDPDASAEDLRSTGVVVDRAAARMSRVVDDLLSYARLETPELEREPVDVATVARELSEEFRAGAAAMDIDLEVGMDPDLWVIGDATGLRQSLANLLANAAELAPEVTSIQIRGGRREGWIWVAVADDGPGIAPEEHERVFQRYWRADSATERRPEGSGLGLSIVRQVAESHGGRVVLDSRPGEGAVFTIWLPAVAPPDPIGRDGCGNAVYGSLSDVLFRLGLTNHRSRR